MTRKAMTEAEGVHNMPTLTDRRSFLRRAVTALAAGAAVNATAIVATRPAPAADLLQEDLIRRAQSISRLSIAD